MKQLVFSIFLAGVIITTVQAQTSAPDARLSGKITYEGMRMVGNGPESGPGNAGPSDGNNATPVVSFTHKLVFNGNMAKEENDRSQTMRMRWSANGGQEQTRTRNGPASTGRPAPPFEQTTFLDLTNRKSIEVLTIRKDSASQAYRTERPLPQSAGWQLSDKTKKIAGYVCHKATVTGRMPRRSGRRDGSSPASATEPAPEETYTIWYTTDLPFTYSPVARLTPDKGVVLQIESDSESFKATTVSTETVDAVTVQPPSDAKVVSPDEMNQLRRKAMTDFRQRMVNSGAFPGRNE